MNHRLIQTRPLLEIKISFFDLNYEKTMYFEVDLNERGVTLKYNKRPYILILSAENRLRVSTRPDPTRFFSSWIGMSRFFPARNIPNVSSRSGSGQPDLSRCFLKNIELSNKVYVSKNYYLSPYSKI